MKLTELLQQNKFTQTLILNVATISAIIVGVFLYFYRGYKNNDGNRKIIKFTKQTLDVVETVVNKAQKIVSEVEVPQVVSDKNIDTSIDTNTRKTRKRNRV